MNNLKKYLNNQQIKPNLSQEELIELKTLLEKQEDSFFTNRKKECYLWEIDKKLKS